MFNVVFRDKTGMFECHNICELMYDSNKGCYNIMYDDYTEENIVAQLIKVYTEE